MLKDGSKTKRMYLNKETIQQLPKIKRLNLINAVTGIKPANLIGTRSNNGISNLAIFSSIVHLGSNPALLAFVLRPQKEVRRHTYENILENGCFTVNHIHRAFMQKAHYTSVKAEKEVSEFDLCALTEEYVEGFHAPFVKESKLKIGLRHKESIPIKQNDTILVVGEIEHLMLAKEAVNEEGYINLEEMENVGISGLNSYYGLSKLADYPYARLEEIPAF